MKSLRILMIAFAFSASVVSAYAQTAPPPAPTATAEPVTAQPSEPDPGTGAFQQRYPRYRIQPGDVMDIRLPFTPELNQTVTVQPDGFVSLNGVGDVHLKDQTAVEATQTLKKAYSSMLRDPAITLVLQQFAKPFFVAGGQVAKPGKYDLHGAITVSQAINVAGGFTDASKHSEVWLYRQMPDGTTSSRKLNVKQMFAKGDLKEDMAIVPGDMIYVPQNTLSKLKGFVIPRATVGTSIQTNPRN